MGFWDKVSDFFKGKNNGDGKNKESVIDKETLEKEKKLLGELGEIEKKYRDWENSKYVPIDGIMPEDPGFEYLGDYDGPSLDEIKNEAKKTWGEKRENEKNKVKDSAGEKINSADGEKNSIEFEKEKKLKELEKQMLALEKNTVNKNTKNGIFNSSIMSEEKDAIGKARDSKEAEFSEDSQNKINEIDKEIDALKEQAKTAIEKLDLDFATKIKDEIESKTKERDSAVKKIIDYNNKIKDAENNYKGKRQQAIEKQIHDRLEYQIRMEKDEAINGYRGEKKKSYDERMRVANEFYDNMPKEMAKKLISGNRDLEKYLGLCYPEFYAKYKE